MSVDYWTLFSFATDDGAALNVLRRSLAVANEEQLEHSLQALAPTTEPKTPV